MEKTSEVIEEKLSSLMCDYEKILTLIKLLKEMQYEEDNYDRKDLMNIISIVYEQAQTTHNILKEIEKTICK